MYIPGHFQGDDASVSELLDGITVGDLVTATERGPVATLLPLLYDASTGDRGSLVGHVARNNDQWSRPALGEAMVIVRGPDAYITPNWYATKNDHGRVVPTWNYVTAHVYGRLVVHDDVDWLEALVRRLTDRHESRSSHPWSVDDAPRGFIDGQLRAIVGVELSISRIEAKFKLSQNRPASDVDGVIAGLNADGQTPVADATRSARDRA
ncbi:FMN-binding negative transcriptional regulator [Asanoa sp. NPDC049573]|uniref:FMN-binding negative transcriptional regulator n=1 Tax=Asanoa sp. NPDC049573 TaxID=3155396 RepID=UPI003445B02A